MSLLSIDVLKEMVPSAGEETINQYLPALNEVLPKFEINTPLRLAHFIAQIAHESGNFRHSIENLNYSAAALRAVFGKYFPTEEMAQEYHRKKEKIANVVYANRLGNGDTESGEGWKYRGRGLIQLTGKSNYEQCSQDLDIDLLENPDAICEQEVLSVSVACWFWDKRKLNEIADQDDLLTITKRINGGTNGLEDRKKHLQQCKLALGIEQESL